MSQEKSGSSDLAFYLCGPLIGLAMHFGGGLPSLTGPRNATKPYETFADFYPFYLSQHADITCRYLHVLGTTFVGLLILGDPKIGISLINAMCVGVLASGLLQGLPNGAVEMVLTVLVYVVSGVSQGVRPAKLITLLICGYFFAWLGHFVFEENKPATFIYPAFSLMGDIRMFVETYKQWFSSK